MPTPEFLRVSEASKLFGVGRSTLHQWITLKLIKPHLIRTKGAKSGVRLISAESLRAFINSHPSN